MPNVENIDPASLAQLSEEQILSFKQGFSPDTQFGVAGPVSEAPESKDAPAILDQQSFDKLSPEQLADFAVQTKWSPYTHAQANPGLEQDDAAVAKLAQADLLLRKRGFKLSDIDWGSVAKAPAALVQGIVSYGRKLVTGAVAPFAEAASQAVESKSPLQVAATAVNLPYALYKAYSGAQPKPWLEAGTKAMGEAIAGSELGVTGTFDLARRGLEKTGRLLRVTKPLDQFTEDDAKKLFRDELAVRNQLGEIAKGKGVTTQEIGGQAVAGVQLDPDEVAKAAAGDPLTLMMFGGGFRIINATTGKVLGFAASRSSALQAVAKLNALRGTTAAAETLAKEIPSAENVAAANAAALEYYSTRAAAGAVPRALETVGKVAEAIPTPAEAVGKAVEVVGKGVEKVIAPAATIGAGVGGLIAGEPTALLALLGGVGAKGAAGRAIGAAGEKIAAFGERLASPEAAGWTRAVSDAINFPVNVGKGALHGLPADLGLAALTADTPEETRESPLMMTAFGGVRGALKSYRQFVRGQTIAPRPWTPSNAWSRNYGHFPEFDAQHSATMKIASDGVHQQIGGMRDLAETTGTELFAFQGPSDMAQALQRAGYSPADAANFAEANAVALGEIPDAQGIRRKVIFIRDPASAPHEVGHPLENLFTQEQQDLLYAQIERQYGSQALLQRAYREAQALAVTPEAQAEFQQDPLRYLIRATGFGKGVDISTPEAAMGLAMRYAAKEIAADTIGTVVKHATPEMLQDNTFLGNVARIMARLMILTGRDPYAGEVAQGPFATPIKFPVAETVRGMVEPFGREAGEAQVRVEPFKPSAPPATPQEGAQKAKEWVDQNPTGNVDKDQAVTGLADALASRQGIRVLYWGAKGDPAGQVTSIRPERRAEIESQRTAANKDRVLMEKEIFPYRVDVRSNGPQFVGWSPDNFVANVGKFAEWLGYVARKGGDVSSVPYELDIQSGRFTARGRADLMADAQKFMENQRAGFTGAGGELVVPAEVEARGYTQPEKTGAAPQTLEQSRADIINYLFNIQIPETVKRVAPLHLAAQEIAVATSEAAGIKRFPGGESIVEPVRPRGEYAPEKLEKAGIPGPRRVQEVNPFRQWVEQTARSAGVARPSLIEVSQRLNINRIEKAVPSLRPETFGGNVLTLAAGFQPSRNPRAVNTAAVRDQETGKIYEGTWHGEALMSALTDRSRQILAERGIPRTDELGYHEQLTDTYESIRQGALDRFEDGFLTNEGEFLNREEALRRAIEVKQIDEQQYTDERRAVSASSDYLESDAFKATRQFQAGPDLARRIAEMPVEEFAKWANKEATRGGYTQAAIDTGVAAPDMEFVNYLKEQQLASSKRVKEIAATGDLTRAMTEANRSQYFREAYEAATGTGSVGYNEPRKNPNYKPPFPQPEAQAQPRGFVPEEPEKVIDYAWLNSGGELSKAAPHDEVRRAEMLETGRLYVDQSPGARGIEVQGDAESFYALSEPQQRALRKASYDTYKNVYYNGEVVEIGPHFAPESQAQPRQQVPLSQEPEALKFAALRRVDDGKIFTGKNHYEAWGKAAADGKRKYGVEPFQNAYEWGFQSNSGEFLDRAEGLKRAREYGQVPEDFGISDRGLESVTFAQAQPRQTYNEASKDEGNPWIRPPGITSNADRLLMVQFSTDLINRDAVKDQASAYYDKLYSGTREGYARLQDFWEIPQWTGFLSKFAPNADLYVVRDMAQAKDFLAKAGYGRVAFSALDVNAKLIKELAKDYKGTFDVGGYAAPSEFKGVPNIKWHDSMKSLAKDMGVPYVEGVDYRHFAGSDVIPRLTMSQGCKHKCAFCTVEKTLKETPQEVIEQQADEIGKLGSKLVYLNDKTFGQAENYKTLPAIYDRIKAINPDFNGFIIQTTASQMRSFTPEYLKKSGIKFVELGIETYNDPILKAMHKPATESLMDRAVAGLREAGIALIPNILIGLPGETQETYTRTLDFLKRNKDIISHANIYNLAVYKEAELGKKLTTASDGDFNENVLEKSWMTNPEIHRTFAGDLYGMASEMLGTKPESAQFQPRGTAQEVPKIEDMDRLWADTPPAIQEAKDEAMVGAVAAPQEAKKAARLADYQKVATQESAFQPRVMSPDEYPEKTLTTYKIFRTLPSKPGKIFPLFIGAKDEVPVGEWVEAELLPKKAGFALRPGWHSGELPEAPQLRSKKTGLQDPTRVWAEVEIPADVDWQSRADVSPTKDIKGEVPKGGHYLFTEFSGVPWYISGALKVNRILSPEEVARIVTEKGVQTPEAKALGFEVGAQPSDKFPKGIPGATFKKVWITPDGENIQLGGMWHSDWLDRNRETAKKFGMTDEEIGRFSGSDTPESRENAIRHGFARVNYDINNGRLTVEARAADWNKLRDAYTRLIEENLNDIDTVRTVLLNRTASEVVDFKETQLFRIRDDKDKMAAVPFIEEAPTRAAAPEVPEFPGLPSLGEVRYKVFNKAGKFIELVPSIEEAKAMAGRNQGTYEQVISTTAQAQPRFSAKEFADELKKVRDGLSGGQTFNPDGSIWTSPETPSDIVTLASVNVRQGELTPERVTEALGPYADLLDEPGVTAGVFSFSQNGKPMVSIDVNLVVPQKYRANTLAFAKANDQVAIWDAAKGEEVRSGGKGNTKLKSLGEISDAIPNLSKGKPVDVDEILRQNRETEPVAETGELFGTKRVLSSYELGNMTKADLARQYPEAVIPGRRDESIPSAITESPLYKAAANESEAVKAFARRLVEFAKEYQNRAEFKSGSKWYSEIVPKLKKVFGKDAKLMAELLAATSPQNAPESNYAYALDALEGFKSGRFDGMIKKYEEGLSKLNDDTWQDWFQKEVDADRVPEPPAEPTPAAFLEHWNFKHGLEPRQSNGKKYGISSPAVLQVLARRWLEKTGGLKTQNFVKNLLGIGHEATIDLWADRTMRRIGYSGFKARWRILPKNATGVSDTDFLFSQKVFRAAAEELGMKPDALQGALWFAEKSLWNDEGWSRLDLGDFRKEIPKTEMLRAGIKERLKRSESQATLGTEQELPLVEPRKSNE